MLHKHLFARFRAALSPRRSIHPRPAPRPNAREARSQMQTALQQINGEFAQLNGKLLQLRDALNTLRGALAQLETQRQRRAQQPAAAPTPPLFARVRRSDRPN